MDRNFALTKVRVTLTVLCHGEIVDFKLFHKYTVYQLSNYIYKINHKLGEIYGGKVINEGNVKIVENYNRTFDAHLCGDFLTKISLFATIKLLKFLLNLRLNDQ